MKKHLIVLIFALALTAGITYLILVVQKRREIERLERLTRIPASEPHQHVSPDGDIVSHTHTYDSPELVRSPEVSEVENDIGIDTETKDYMKENDIQRIWAALDLDAIRREFQPYTLEEIHEKWRHHFSVPRFTGRTVGTERSPLTAVEKTDIFRDREEWIARLYEYGHPFLRANQYKDALSIRSGLEYIYELGQTSEDHPHGSVGLPPEATREEVEETFLKHHVIAEIAFERAYQADPDNFAGGWYSISDVGKGVLTPFKENTVYVHVSEDKPFSKLTGVRLTDAEKTALTMFGIAPKGVRVIYTDKNGIPLPADQKPRFYERAMEGLDAAEKRVAKLIADHDALFQQENGGIVQKSEPPSGRVSEVPLQTHPPEDASSDRTAADPDRPILPPQVLDKMQLPTAPGALPDPVQVEKWFTELLLLHGGDLPADVKGLQEAIKVLSALRARGESEPQEPPDRSALPPPSRK